MLNSVASQVAVAIAMLVVTACPPAPIVVKSAKEIGTFQGPTINGRDGGASIATSAGLVLIFGDSFLKSKDSDGSSFHSSSYSVTRDMQTFEEPTDALGTALPFLDATAAERAFNLDHQAGDDGACAAEPCGDRTATWPGTTVVDGRGGFLTFYGLVSAGNGAYNFRGIGTGVATWTGRLADRPDRPSFGVDDERPTNLFLESEPPFGTAAFASVGGGDAPDDALSVDTDGVSGGAFTAATGDGFLYAFGCEVTFLAAPCKLARVRLDDALDRSRWTFFTGDGYVDDIDKAKDVVEAAPIATVGRLKDRFLLVYSGVASNEVRARVADRLEGPWSDAVVLFTGDHGDDGNVYDAYWHPHNTLAGADDLVVTYTRSTGAFASVTVIEIVAVE